MVVVVEEGVSREPPASSANGGICSRARPKAGRQAGRVHAMGL